MLNLCTEASLLFRSPPNLLPSGFRTWYSQKDVGQIDRHCTQRVSL